MLTLALGLHGVVDGNLLYLKLGEDLADLRNVVQREQELAFKSRQSIS